LVKVFKEVDEYLTGKNIQLAIEPNTLSYGGEYFSKLPEIIEFISSNNLVNVKTMIDTHNLILEKNDPIFEVEKYFDYICHVHVSEPKLDIIKDTTFHREFSKKLKDLNYNKTITYEVNKCDGLTESIKLFSEIYNN
jgi:sugar phosphate isomerase/epimerase